MRTLLDLFNGAPASSLILVAMLAASALALTRMPELLERQLFRPYWLARRNQYATVFTSAFLHADLPHLAFNAFTFWSFGFGLERAIGTPRFVALYVVGLLASSGVTWWRQRRNPVYASLGASGAILAVLFASILYAPTQSIYILPIPLPIPAPLFALCYLGYTVYASRQDHGRINHDAHWGGAVAGLLFVMLVDPQVVGRAFALVQAMLR